ncbi:MAG: tetratricopeptide repeat protein [Chthoniobacter sp.]|nr:tetratricopeptide repeat protein [Chthoniobacter sp.]
MPPCEPIPPSATPEPARPRRGLALGICGLLALLTLLTFGQSVRYGFIGFDDDRYVDHNPALEAGLSARGLVWAFSTNLTHFDDSAEYWEPLTLLTRLADYQAYGFQPWGHHLTSVLLHLATGLALFGALWRLTGAQWRSALVAALFLVHPLHVEPVLWLSARKDLVSGLFYVLTLWAYGWYVACPNWRRYLVVFAGALAASMGKPMAVSLPFVLLLLDVWPLRRWPGNEASRARRVGTLVGEKAPLFLLTFVIAVLAIVAQKHIGAMDFQEALPLSLRLGNAAVAIVTYVVKAFVPVKLAFFYPHPGHNLNALLAVAAAMVTALVSEFVIGQWRRRPWLTVGWYWFLLVLAPMLGLIQIGDQAMADRYSYLALIGVFIAVVWQAAEWVEKTRSVTRVLLSGVLVFGGISALSVVCFFQVQTWQSSQSVFSHALAVTTGNYVAEYNLGVVLWKKGEQDAAMRHFQQAVRIRGPVLETQIAAADTAAERGAYAEAISRLRRVLVFMPWRSELHQRLGTWYALDHAPAKALAQFEAALQYNPDGAGPRVSIAALLIAEGQLQKAEKMLRDVLDHEPGNTEAQAMLESLPKQPGAH